MSVSSYVSMDKARFLQLTKASFDQSVEEQSENLKAALVQLDGDEILEFHRLFRELEVAAYRWDLWGVAYIINGGCSDDCFIDFRSMLVRRGEKFYNAMLTAPKEMTIAYDLKEENWKEMFGYGLVEVYEELTGQPFPPTINTLAHEFLLKPMGKRWEEEELEALFPRLCEKFG